MREDRLVREAAFHDKAFTERTRASAGKFYEVAASGKEAYRRAVSRDCPGKDLLEYGCGTGGFALHLSQLGARVSGIDISSEGVRLAKEKASRLGQSDASFYVMNAEELGFSDSSFDTVCGSGILHHLRIPAAMSEVCRVLRPKGRAVFFEPLGHNLFINMYRRLTPGLRSEDEHPLLMRDLDLIQRHFDAVTFRYYCLTSLLAVPFRGVPGFGALLSALRALDRLLLSLPGLRSQAWIVLMELAYPRPERDHL